MKKAAFLDRDGTINEDIGYLFSEEKLVFIPKAFEALKILQEEYLLFIITNQPGIEQGVFSESRCADFSKRYEEILKKEGITVQKTFFCPHMKQTGCGCIKPKTFFIEKILEEEEDIDPGASFTAGDHPHDVEMGKRAGMKTVYLLTGHGRHHLEELQALSPDITAENLYEAALGLTENPRAR